MPKEKSVLIGIPCLDTIKTETVSSLFFAQNTLDIPAILHIHKSSLVHDARNKIVQKAIDRGVSHVLFIDSDIAFEPEAINKLMAQNKDIVGGLYFRKQRPHKPTIGMKNGKRIETPEVWSNSAPFEVFSIGTGFLLVKTEVFESISPKWFGFGQFHGQEMGEDVFFCRKAQAKKYKVWCDPTVKIAHVGEYLYDQQDYELYKGNDQSEYHEDVWSQL